MLASRASSRPEATFVLLMMQSMFWVIAGLSALPFVFAGEVFMLGLGVATLLLALGMVLLAIGVLWRRRWARRWVIVVEIICLAAALLQWMLPIGANHGPVALMTNVALPIAVFVLLRKPRDAFG
ncbi:MAG: hypothetical protein NVS9B11_02570 [Candidatus Dormibacteraceae bacterium]